MSVNQVDSLIFDDNRSDPPRYQEMPQIDLERRSCYRMAGLRQQLELHKVAIGLTEDLVAYLDGIG